MPVSCAVKTALSFECELRSNAYLSAFLHLNTQNHASCLLLFKSLSVTPSYMQRGNHVSWYGSRPCGSQLSCQAVLTPFLLPRTGYGATVTPDFPAQTESCFCHFSEEVSFSLLNVFTPFSTWRNPFQISEAYPKPPSSRLFVTISLQAIVSLTSLLEPPQHYVKNILFSFLNYTCHVIYIYT